MFKIKHLRKSEHSFPRRDSNQLQEDPLCKISLPPRTCLHPHAGPGRDKNNKIINMFMQS